MKRSRTPWVVVLAVLLAGLMSGCLETKQPISGPGRVRVHEIDDMRRGGLLRAIEQDGKLSETNRYAFRATPEQTIAIDSWSRRKKAFVSAREMTVFTVPSGDYFIARMPTDTGQAYYYGAFQFQKDDEVRWVTAEGLEATRVGDLSFTELVAVFDNLVADRRHRADGMDIEPRVERFRIDFSGTTAR